MLTDNSKNKLNELLSMLNQTDIEVVPRIIMVTKDDKNWRETITKGIIQDISIFKSSEFTLSCKRYFGDELESMKFKGDLCLALHNVLASLNGIESMVITVENTMRRFPKGIKVEKTMKLVYIVLKV